MSNSGTFLAGEMYGSRISEFGRKFSGRVDPDLLKAALDYIEYNEEALAFETICDHLSEYDILIANDEYREAMQLASDMGFDVSRGPFKHPLGLSA